MNIKKNLKNNTYYFSISLGIDPITCKRKQTTRNGFKTRKDAEIEYNKMRLLYLESQNINTKISFKALIKNFCEHRKEQVKISTYNNEYINIKNHILPYFEKSDITKILRQHILDYRDKLIEKTDLSNNTINKIMLVLKMIFQYAVENQYINRKPFEHIKQLKTEKPFINFWTPQEFKKFNDFITSKKINLRYIVFYRLAYLTGARLSELLALTWNDINFYNYTVRISKSLKYDKLNKCYYLDTTKTKSSERTIALNKKMIEILEELKQQSKAIYIFSYDENFPKSKTFTEIFSQLQNEIDDLKKIRFHDLRHSHVALLIDMQEQDFLIKERMGHSSIKITYDVYGHLFPTRQHELATRLDSVI